MAKIEKEVPSVFVGSLEDFVNLTKSGFKDVGSEADFQRACDESELDDRCLACGNLLPASAEDSFCYICRKQGIAERFAALLCDRAKLSSQLETANAKVKELMGGLDWASGLLEDAESIMDKLTAKIEKRDATIAKLKKRLKAAKLPTEVSL